MISRRTLENFKPLQVGAMPDTNDISATNAYLSSNICFRHLGGATLFKWRLVTQLFALPLLRALHAGSYRIKPQVQRRFTVSCSALPSALWDTGYMQRRKSYDAVHHSYSGCRWFSWRLLTVSALLGSQRRAAKLKEINQMIYPIRDSEARADTTHNKGLASVIVESRAHDRLCSACFPWL